MDSVDLGCNLTGTPNVVIPRNVTDAEIYAKNCDDLLRYAAVLVGPDEAPDVVSTVVVRVLGKGTLAGLREARPYLFRAVLNEARSVLRRRRPTWPLTLGESTEEPPELRPEVAKAVLALPSQQRAATYLIYWQDLTVAEAARLMGTTPGTVKRYVHLARKRLRGALDEYA